MHPRQLRHCCRPVLHTFTVQEYSRIARLQGIQSCKIVFVARACNIRCICIRVVQWKLNTLHQRLHKFLSESHISYYTTVRGPDFLLNVIVLEYVTFYQINKFFVNILLVHYWLNDFAGRISPAGCSFAIPTLHKREIHSFNQYHCTPVVGKLWTSDQL